MPGIHMFCSLKKVRLRDSVYVKLKVGRGTCEIIFRTDLIPQQFMKLEVLTAIISRLVVIKGNNTAGTNIFFFHKFYFNHLSTAKGVYPGILD